MKFKLFFLTAVGLLSLLSGKNLFADDDILWHNSAWGENVFFNSTGTLLAVTGYSQDDDKYLVKSSSGEIMRIYSNIVGISSKKFSRNGKIFAFSPFDDGIIFINAETLDTIRKSKIKSLFFDFSFDDNYFITANLSVAGIFINKYDIKTDSLISSFKFLFTPNKYDISMNYFVVSPTDNNIAFCGTELYNAHLYGQFNKIIDLNNKKIIGDFSSNDLKLKYSGTGILAAIDSGRIKFYDEKAELIKTLKDSSYVFYDFCFNEVDNEIITCGSSTGIRIWDYNTLKLKSTYYNPVFYDGPGVIGYNSINHILAVCAEGTYAFDYSKIVLVNDNGNIQTVINIIPNPTVNQVSINIQKENILNINLRISDLTGKVIMSKDYLNINSNSFNTTINTSNLPSGTLFFNLTIDGKLFTKQVIIIK